MTETAQTKMHRIDTVPEEVIDKLAYQARDPDLYGQRQRRVIYDGLPVDMTPEEIVTLGLLVGGRVEQAAPSRSGYTNSERAEVEALFFVGRFASANGHNITLGNVIEHLKHRGGLRGKLGALVLSRERGTVFSDFMPKIGKRTSHAEPAAASVAQAK